MAWRCYKRGRKYCLLPISHSLKHGNGKNLSRGNERLFARGVKVKCDCRRIDFRTRAMYIASQRALLIFFSRSHSLAGRGSCRGKRDFLASFRLSTTHLHGFPRRCWWRDRLFCEAKSASTSDKKSRSIRTIKRCVINLVGYGTRAENTQIVREREREETTGVPALRRSRKLLLRRL